MNITIENKWIIIAISILAVNFIHYFLFYENFNLFKDPPFYFVLTNNEKLVRNEVYTWNEDNLGHNSLWGVAKLPFVPIFLIFKYLPYKLSVSIFSFAIILLNFIGMFLFLKDVIHFGGRYRLYTITITSLIFSLNPFTAIMIISGGFLFAPYALSPLLIYFLYKATKSNERRYIYYSSFLVFLILTVFFNPATTIISLTIVFIISLIVFDTPLTKLIKSFILTLSISIFLSFFLIMPLLSSFLTSSQNIKKELDRERFYSLNSIPLEIFKMSSQWAVYFENNGYRTFEFGPYLKQISPLLILFPIFSFLCLLYIKNFSKKEKKIVLGVSLLFILGFLLSWGYNDTSPIKGLFDTELFKPFRNNYKFVGIINISYSILFFFSLLLLINRKRLKTIPFIFSVLIFIVLSYPFWSGKLFNKNDSNIPNEIFQASDFINSQKDDGRVMILPGPWMPSYYWVKPHIQQPIFTATINKQLVYRPGGMYLGNEFSRLYLEKMYLNFFDLDKNDLIFNRIKWIILDGTYDNNFFIYNVTPTSNLTMIEGFVQKVGFSLLRKFGNISVFYLNESIYPEVFYIEEINNKENQVEEINIVNIPGIASSVWKWVNSSDKSDFSLNGSYIKLSYELNNRGSIALLHFKLFDTPIDISEVDSLELDVFSPVLQNASVIVLIRGDSGKFTIPLKIEEIRWEGWKHLVFKIPKTYLYDNLASYKIDWIQIGVQSNTESLKGFLIFKNIKLTVSKENEKSIYNYIDYERINPTLYKARINTTRPFILCLSQAYDPLWEARVYKDGKLVEKVKPVPLYGVINGFWINTTGDNLEIVIRYTPQDWFEIGLVISGLTFASSLFYLFYDWRRSKKDKWALALEKKISKIIGGIKHAKKKK